MKILQFGYGHDNNHVSLSHFFERHQVAYTDTHDNDTTQGWLDSLQGEMRELVFNYFDLMTSRLKAEKLVWSSSPCRTCLVSPPLAV